MVIKTADGFVKIHIAGLPPIHVHGGAFALSVLIALPLWFGLQPNRLIAAGLVSAGAFLSILAHELGHAFTARHCGLHVGLIRLHGAGGDASFGGEAWTAAQDRMITLAGPLVNLALGIACLAAYRLLLPDPWQNFTPGEPWSTPPPIATPPLARAALWLGWLNIAWFAVNLLPAFPLDGGRLAFSLLEPRLGEHRALMWVGGAGTALAALSALVFAVSLIGGFVVWSPPSLRPSWEAFKHGRKNIRRPPDKPDLEPR